MKKIKMIAIATVSLIGIGGAFSFTKPLDPNCGFRNGNHYEKGVLSGQYSCNTAHDVTCTFTSSAANAARCDTGTFSLNP